MTLKNLSYNKIMKWVRRFHLYLGLLLLPFILLYGITGFLLNHPSFFEDHKTHWITTDELKSSFNDIIPAPAQIAAILVDSLKSRDSTSQIKIKILNPDKAQFKSRMAFRADDDSTRRVLQMDPSEMNAKIHEWPVQKKAPSPFKNVPKLKVSDSLKADLVKAAKDVYTKKGMPSEGLWMLWGPLMEFDLEIDGKKYVATYNMTNLNLNIRPAHGWRRLVTFRNFLIRLHFSHTYPLKQGIRTVWAVMVDTVAISLVLWAITGFLMWLQIKVVRFTGAILAIIGLLWAFGLAFLMYEVLTL
jgi:hypothetical protein